MGPRSSVVIQWEELELCCPSQGLLCKFTKLGVDKRGPSWLSNLEIAPLKLAVYLSKVKA